MHLKKLSSVIFELVDTFFSQVKKIPNILSVLKMSHNKRNRVSRYAEIDESFTYDPTENYSLNDFSNLSVTKIQSIASSMYLRNVKRYKKDELVPLVFQKHEELHNRLNSLGQETNEHEHQVLETNSVSRTTNDALEFTEQLKMQFREIAHYKYNNDVWFQASSVAYFLEYENTTKAISDHVDVHDKTNWDFITSSTPSLGLCMGKMHPETIFINKYGIFDLVTKSRMPLARQFRKWLVTEVLPSIIDNGAYISPAITQTQIMELQIKIEQIEQEKQQVEIDKQQLENEKQQLQLQLSVEKQIRLSKINRNQIQNSIPLDELYIITSKQYAREYIYKIGKSNNTPKRLQSLNTSRIKEDELYICHRAKCYDANSAETHIHTLLSRYRLQNSREFFVIEFEDVRRIMDHVCQCFCADYNVCMQIIMDSQNRPLPEINLNIPPPCTQSNEESKSSNVITNYYNREEL